MVNWFESEVPYFLTRAFKEDIKAIKQQLTALTPILKGEQTIMADIDILNAAVGQLQSDESAEEALGLKIEAGIQALQAQADPNLGPAIAALQALHVQITNDTTAGGTLLSTLPTPTTGSTSGSSGSTSSTSSVSPSGTVTTVTPAGSTPAPTPTPTPGSTPG